MFCYQCEQTDRSGEQVGCHSSRGNCGKDEGTASLTNVNFNPTRFVLLLGEADAVRERARTHDEQAARERASSPSSWVARRRSSWPRTCRA
jgi:hydroxylamine reductase